MGAPRASSTKCSSAFRSETLRHAQRDAGRVVVFNASPSCDSRLSLVDSIAVVSGVDAALVSDTTSMSMWNDIGPERKPNQQSGVNENTGVAQYFLQSLRTLPRKLGCRMKRKSLYSVEGGGKQLERGKWKMDCSLPKAASLERPWVCPNSGGDHGSY